MKFKKIIKGIIGVGVVGGVAYLAYKVGECSGEMNERIHKLADTEDDAEENSVPYDYDEPDDGCIAPHEDYRLWEADKFDTEGYDENCDNGDHFFTRLRNIDSDRFSTKDIMRAVFIIMDSDRISNKKLREELGISLSEAEIMLNIFEAAGYVSERDDRYVRKVYIKNMTLDDLF